VAKKRGLIEQLIELQKTVEKSRQVSAQLALSRQRAAERPNGTGSGCKS
jgi:hypothetical protein